MIFCRTGEFLSFYPSILLHFCNTCLHCPRSQWLLFADNLLFVEYEVIITVLTHLIKSPCQHTLSTQALSILEQEQRDQQQHQQHQIENTTLQLHQLQTEINLLQERKRETEVIHKQSMLDLQGRWLVYSSFTSYYSDELTTNRTPPIVLQYTLTIYS